MKAKKFVMQIVALVALMAFSVSLALAHDTTINLTEQNASGQNGTTVFTSLDDGTTKVTINISGGSGVAQPAHIHAGTCANLDPKPMYPLNNVVSGQSETIVPVDLHDLTGGAFAVNVHKSATEASVYVSCGNIVAATHTESPGMPTTGSGDSLTIAALAALGAVIVSGTGAALRRRAARKA
jgi:hypothetical protein